jgi:hypothetical protein
VGQGLELEVLAAVILGGASLLGGSGTIFKTVIGVLILGFIQNGLLLVGLQFYVQFVVTWVIIILAVWLDIAGQARQALVADRLRRRNMQRGNTQETAQERRDLGLHRAGTRVLPSPVSYLSLSTAPSWISTTCCCCSSSRRPSGSSPSA